MTKAFESMYKNQPMGLEKNRPKFYFKWIRRDGWATHVNSFSYNYYLPENGRPGQWLPRIKGDLIKCHIGYHLMRPSNITSWGQRDYRLFLVQIDSAAYDGGNKIVCRRFRFLRQIPSIRKPPYGNTWYFYSDQRMIVKALAKAGIKLLKLPKELRATYKKYRK